MPFGWARVTADRCSLCGLCAARCPTGALRYEERGHETALLFEAAECAGSDLCVAACPERALEIVRQLGGLAPEVTPVLLKSAALRRCRRCGRGYAPEAMVSRILSSLGQRAFVSNLDYCPDCRMTAAV
ncbi:MAG TPA: 4Fe-4S dicluster domain-containing protein [Dehalococcoidia bacterium]|nr:4Fe-4S dicluster domain-containing protein [Dehalococcoidia bacterium]